MKFILRKIGLIIGLFLSAFMLNMGTLTADELPSYFCSADKGTGFHFKNGKWDQSSFSVKNEKFIIRPIKSNEVVNPKLLDHTKWNYFVTVDMGEDRLEHHCEQLVEYGPNTNIFCRTVSGELKFSPESGRYIETLTYGYWRGRDEGSDTPGLIIGRCSKI